MDEVIHIFSGYTYLTQGDFRLNAEHPPLLKELAALPLLFIHPKLPLSPAWNRAESYYADPANDTLAMARRFLFTSGNDATRMVFWTRLPFILLTLVLGICAYLWAGRLYNARAGLFAAFLVLLCPTVLAHGHLVTTDLGLTVFMFLSVYFWCNYLVQPGIRKLALAGLFSGIAFASKYTALFLLPMLMLLVLIKLFAFDKSLRPFKTYLLGFIAILIMGFLIVWASYRFSLATPPPIPSTGLAWGVYRPPAFLGTVFHSFQPVFFPAPYFKGLFMLTSHALTSQKALLFGQISDQGWWYYFPVAIFYKTPVPFFIFLLLAAIYHCRAHSRFSFEELTLVAAPLMYLGLSMFSKVNIGVRHVLPIFPFLCVFAAQAADLLNRASRPASTGPRRRQPAQRTVIPPILLTVVLSLLSIWYLMAIPISRGNYLAYFNEFAGGPNGGYRYLGDSNLDWGQDIFRIKNYMDTQGLRQAYFIYPWDGTEGLQFYGLTVMPFPPANAPIQGCVIASATYLQFYNLQRLFQFPHEQITPGVFIFYVASS
jgi:predicted membrane-bound dolichyl-phosphate-mannose-protein mannosyltransferase